MVSFRCQLSVKGKLNEAGLLYGIVGLGEAEILPPVATAQLEQFKKSLLLSGFELLEDNKSILIERIRITVMNMVHNDNALFKLPFSNYISNRLGYDYTYLANIFSEVKGISIERFFLLHKTERVKELLSDDELSLTEIVRKLNYCSTSHLCNQFKKITGVTPTEFKSKKLRMRINLENL